MPHIIWSEYEEGDIIFNRWGERTPRKSDKTGEAQRINKIRKI